MKCLKDGRLDSFGAPYELIKDENTILHNLVHSLESSESLKLTAMAKVAFQENTNKEEQQQLLNKSNKIS